MIIVFTRGYSKCSNECELESLYKWKWETEICVSLVGFTEASTQVVTLLCQKSNSLLFPLKQPP